MRDLTVGPASPFFSINNGVTNLGTYNNPATGGDASDWVRTLAGDLWIGLFGGAPASFPQPTSSKICALGYKFSAAGLAATHTLGLA